MSSLSLLEKRKEVCSCTYAGCKLRLERYDADPNAPYPGGKRQLIFALGNPSFGAPSRNRKQAARKRQVYDRAVALLGIPPAPPRKRIKIGISHFHPEVIRGFNESGSEGRFLDFLLPKSLVSNNNLGATFTSFYAFNCVRTDKKARGCSVKKGCSCGRFLNVPLFAPGGAEESIGAVDSKRARRAATFSSARSTAIAPVEVKVQRARRASAYQDELDFARKQLAYSREEADTLKRKREEEQKAAAAEISRLREQVARLSDGRGRGRGRPRKRPPLPLSHPRKDVPAEDFPEKEKNGGRTYVAVEVAAWPGSRKERSASKKMRERGEESESDSDEEMMWKKKSVAIAEWPRRELEESAMKRKKSVAVTEWPGSALKKRKKKREREELESESDERR